MKQIIYVNGYTIYVQANDDICVLEDGLDGYGNDSDFRSFDTVEEAEKWCEDN